MQIKYIFTLLLLTKKTKITWMVVLQTLLNNIPETIQVILFFILNNKREYILYLYYKYIFLYSK